MPVALAILPRVAEIPSARFAENETPNFLPMACSPAERFPLHTPARGTSRWANMPESGSGHQLPNGSSVRFSQVCSKCVHGSWVSVSRQSPGGGLIMFPDIGNGIVLSHGRGTAMGTVIDRPTVRPGERIFGGGSGAFVPYRPRQTQSSKASSPDEKGAKPPSAAPDAPAPAQEQPASQDQSTGNSPFERHVASHRAEKERLTRSVQERQPKSYDEALANVRALRGQTSQPPPQTSETDKPK
jgi:hypothetical protein